MPSKDLTFFGKHFDIEGVGIDDPYFKGLSDNADSDFSKVITTFLTPDSVALDIGANIGITSCILSQHLHQGRVFAFEPSPSVYPILSRNLSANAVQNVVARQNAVGSQKGTLGFVGESAYGHLVAGEANTGQPDGNGVAVETLDGIVKELKLDRLDFIKIDVEGFEDDVLEGGHETEAQFTPLYYMEFNAFCIAAYRQMNPYDFAKRVLADFKYVFHVNHLGELTPVEGDAAYLLHKNIVDEGSVSNLLMTNSSERLKGRGFGFIQDFIELQSQLADALFEKHHAVSERDRTLAERDRTLAERDRTLAERDHARRYPWKYLRGALDARKRRK